MNDYRISPEAELDLAQIWHFIAEDNPLAANEFIGRLLNAMEKLQIEPRIGRVREDLQPGLRSHPHANYLILYKIEHDVVIVVRVIQGARDTRQAMAEPPEPPSSI